MPPPAFTVVVPLYNKRAFIERTVASILAQSFSDFELIVVDDGSRDGSPELVEAIDDSRIRLIRQANAGPGAARNQGFASARAPWVALIDADDHWRPAHLAELARVIASVPTADAVATTSISATEDQLDSIEVDTGGATIREINYLGEAEHGKMLNSSCIAIRRTVFLESGGFGPFCPGEDTELWARLALDHVIAKSDAATSFYLRSNDGIMDQLFAERFGERTSAPAPVIETLDRALTNPRYTARRGDIVAYKDRAFLSGAKQALFAGRHEVARGYLKRIAGHRSGKYHGYALLSRLPVPLVRAGIRLASRLRTRRQAPAVAQQHH